MRIAFVGKGGSGKTTVSALFSLYMDSLGMTVGLLDVDVNSHTAEVLGITSDGQYDLSQDSVSNDIRRHLIGSRDAIFEDEFLNSTPPGRGSNMFSPSADNYVTKKYGQPFGDKGHVFTVGSYKDQSIGIDCHHSTQYIAENLLSHAELSNQQLLVIDSVAGNDAFGNSLYMQDLLVFVVKPEREGIHVFERFYELAVKAGIGDRVVVVGNQVATDRQRDFLRDNIDPKLLLGILPVSDEIVDARLDGEKISLGHVASNYQELFKKLYNKAKTLKQSEDVHYKNIIDLHRKISQESWVVGSYRSGMQDQIDPLYRSSGASNER
ncbi:hypothetical protein A2707_05655 [Candidatus Saccharibacteria bacterium RIFCSPHIGHO2_01_FULL_45_15]|nr:MAG: hypothetical protein A2707_05655 [Candidatus Saccharibacteria bacterium RIFCSPHIGHO2_01_FULL_45_15]OGL28932.1 MAG: hypothetical protein A3C39_05875 [Candidatus Saccharibacteria bacterium RIFCSPHIGHO2_02_FULL_46_12]OGL31945.1 MAG: hypothetical protein A3E76_01600 [Candidatus Saccharibacteria bacterium RIFCSPHIGHO2_12_FULL_44_22]